MSSTAQFVGCFLGVSMFAGIIINFAVLYAIIAGMITKRRMRKNSIYIIACSNLLCDNGQLILNLIVLPPSIVKWQWHLSRFNVWLISVGFMYFWYHTSLSQILMSLNRYLAVVDYRNLSCFQWTKALIVTILINPMSVLMAMFSQYFSPCCVFDINYELYSYSYTTIEDTFNYSNYIIDLPLNSSSSIIAAVSYSLIILHMRKTRSRLSVCLAPATFLRKKNREYRYAMQFAFISLFYTIAWVFFRTFPHFVAPGPLYALIPFFVTLHSSSNAIIYILTNPEIRGELGLDKKVKSPGSSSLIGKKRLVVADL